MRLVRLAARILLAVLAALGASLVALRLAAPWPIPGHEADAALLVIAQAELPQRSIGPVYVSFEGRDPSAANLEKLRRDLGGRQVLPMSERRSTNDHCEPSAPGIVVIGACKEDNFIDVRLQAIPLWGVALVTGATAACGFEYVLARPAGAWLRISSRSVCT